MKIRKSLAVCLSALLFIVSGCSAPGGEKASSAIISSATSSSSSVSESGMNVSSSVTSGASSEPVSGNGEVSSKNGAEESTSSATQVSPKVSQNNSDWVAYDTNKDGYKLHIKKADGTEDKVIVNDVVLAPCVAGEWVYFFSDLSTIEKVRLDGSQRTKVCGTDAFQVYNVNLNTYHGLNGSTSITAEYLDGYILYTCFQLHEVGDKPNPLSYYKLDPDTNKITEVKG